MPEGINITVPQSSIDIPHSSNEILTQDQPEEKRNSSAVGSNAAMSQQDPLDKPTDKDREPHPVHGPTACQGIGNWM